MAVKKECRRLQKRDMTLPDVNQNPTLLAPGSLGGPARDQTVEEREVE